MAVLTNHGEWRLRKRVGIPKSAADKVADKALEHGIGRGDCNGPLRRYLEGIYFAYGSGNNVRIYNRKVYVFEGPVLITVFNLPKKYLSRAESILRRKTACQ